MFMLLVAIAERFDFDPGAANFYLSAMDGDDIFLVKLDPLGKFLWANGFGGIAEEMGNSLSIGPNNAVYLAGFFSGTVDFAPGNSTVNLTAELFNSDLFFAKYLQADTGTSCVAPANTVTSSILPYSAKVSWDEVAGAFKYQVQYKPAGTTTWMQATSTTTSKKVKGIVAINHVRMAGEIDLWIESNYSLYMVRKKHSLPQIR
jgi:hypothetical protein